MTMPLPITHVATSDITDMMHPAPGRRMDLPGFDEEFVDFPHYIIRITERIWHDREIDLCLKWYTPDCLIHTLGGDIVGAQTVAENTRATLAVFNDRRLDADNVIWSEDEPGTFYSSHLITSKMTHTGPGEFGPATGKRVRVQTIADCLCRDNRIFREWLVRDNLGLVMQLGLDPDAVAARQSAADGDRMFSLIDFHAGNRARAQASHGSPRTDSPGIATAFAALSSLWQSRSAKHAEDIYDFRVAGAYPGAVSLYGPDDLCRWFEPLWAAFPDLSLSIDHVAEIGYLGDARDVAVRWSATGLHTGHGRYGAPTGAPIFFMGVSQMRVMNGRVREDVCIWDDLAVRRQVAEARRR
ncbi:MAG: ester cyclase [Hyphomonas sp.]|uniref:ester cyclase n=1 Tax=Hyphomonas sp. TaxID=87 RepID=UPI0034A0A208